MKREVKTNVTQCAVSVSEEPRKCLQLWRYKRLRKSFIAHTSHTMSVASFTNAV